MEVSDTVSRKLISYAAGRGVMGLVSRVVPVLNTVAVVLDVLMIGSLLLDGISRIRNWRRVLKDG